MRVPFGSLPFLFFVIWLLAVPMEGPLLTICNASGQSLWFLGSHVVFLVLLSRFMPADKLGIMAHLGAVACALLTLALFFYTESAAILLLVMGVAAAPMDVKACLSLLKTPHPLRAAAWALVLANLALAGIRQSLGFSAWPIFFTILPLLTISATQSGSADVSAKPPLALEYLPFVFFFQMVSGLMYAFWYPAYAQFGWIFGGELFFYMAAVVVAVTLYGWNRDLLLVCAMTLGMGAFALLQTGGTIAINLGMFAMMAATGCIDLFLLALILQSARPIKAIAVGLSILCGGIAAGQILSLALGAQAGSIGMAGSLVLNVAAMTLFFRHQHRLTEMVATLDLGAHQPVSIPPELEYLLSDREQQVLMLVLGGKNYREVAETLMVSESTVKTYMKRICAKVGASDRRQLLQRLVQY